MAQLRVMAAIESPILAGSAGLDSVCCGGPIGGGPHLPLAGGWGLGRSAVVEQGAKAELLQDSQA
jgi:hypothetical protein